MVTLVRHVSRCCVLLATGRSSLQRDSPGRILLLHPAALCHATGQAQLALGIFMQQIGFGDSSGEPRAKATAADSSSPACVATPVPNRGRPGRYAVT